LDTSPVLEDYVKEDEARIKYIKNKPAANKKIPRDGLYVAPIYEHQYRHLYDYNGHCIEFLVKKKRNKGNNWFNYDM
jgi:hypothetical protein